MREEIEEPNWFARWEEELPTPEELMPLSQTLITPDLALAFDIPNPTSNNTNSISNLPPSSLPSSSSLHQHHQHHHHHQLHHHQLPPATHQSADFDSADLGSSGGGGGGGGGGSATNGGDEPARTLKRPRLVWTPQLHKRFVDAVAHLGIKNAVPKTIMQLMSVDGLTRENVASHLQKYRLYLKRMQGLSPGGGGGGVGGGSGGPISAADAATDQLFASGPLPHHFLSRGGGGAHSAPGTEPPFLPYMPVAALQHHQMAVAVQQQFYHQRQLGGHFGPDHGLFARGGPPLQPPGLNRMGPGGGGGTLHNIMQQPVAPAGDVDDLEEGSRGGGGGRRVLTLFPTGED